jgi:hypothetical protein
LKPIFPPAEPPSGAVVSCDVLAFSGLQLAPEEVRQLRQSLVLPSGERLPAAFLKQAEDQTIVALAAVCEAMRRHDLTESSFSTWGVLGAPRFLGRVAMVSAIEKMRVEGAWGISPHLIPHRLLHALSGAVSLAFKFRGPNFGVGGGPSGVGEALLTAAAMLEGARLPGLWVVLTGFDPEPDTRAESGSGVEGRCISVALALVAAQPGCQGLRLKVRGTRGRTAGREPVDSMSLEALLQLITQQNEPRPSSSRAVPLGAGISLEGVGSSPALPAPRTFRAPAKNGYHGQARAGVENEL